jgi:hypothetical protein
MKKTLLMAALAVAVVGVYIVVAESKERGLNPNY